MPGSRKQSQSAKEREAAKLLLSFSKKPKAPKPKPKRKVAKKQSKKSQSQSVSRSIKPRMTKTGRVKFPRPHSRGKDIERPFITYFNQNMETARDQYLKDANLNLDSMSGKERFNLQQIVAKTVGAMWRKEHGDKPQVTRPKPKNNRSCKYGIGLDNHHCAKNKFEKLDVEKQYAEFKKKQEEKQMRKQMRKESAEFIAGGKKSESYKSANKALWTAKLAEAYKASKASKASKRSEAYKASQKAGKASEKMSLGYLLQYY